MKKILSLLLAVAVVIGALPSAVLANSFYIIRTPEDFKSYITGVENGSVTLGAFLYSDIDISDVYPEYTPPGVEYNYTFEGNNHTISGLNITSGENAALFESIGASGTVRDLTIEGSVGGSNGASVAVNNSGTIANVTNRADVAGNKYASGIVCNNKGTVSSCENLADVNALNKAHGAGIAAVNQGIIASCVNYGTVNGVDGSVYSENIAGIAAVSSGTYAFENNINTGAVYGGANTAGIVSSYTSTGKLSGCINTGDISGSTKAAGIVSSAVAADVADCVNYGNIVGTGEYIAGIAADCINVSNCTNYGSVDGTEKISGIAAQLYGSISSCFNYGPVSGISKVAGVVANSYYADLYNCTNYGDISGQESRVAGVIAYSAETSMDKCANYGDIAGGLSGSSSANFVAGVAAEISTSDSGYVKDVYSVGNIQGKNTVAAVIGMVGMDVTGGFKYISGDTAIHSSYDEYGKYMYEYYTWGYKTAFTDKFDTGELAWMLNTYEGTMQNRGVWSQGKLYPILADEHNKPVKKILCKYSGKETVLYTGANGYANAVPGIPSDAEFCGEDGALLAYDEVFGNAAASSTAYVYDAEGFVSAAADESVSAIVLQRGIFVDAAVEIAGSKTIIGNNNRITFADGGITAAQSLTLDSVSIGSVQPVVVNGGTLTVKNNVEITSPIKVNAGGIDVSEGRILNRYAKSGAADFIADDGVTVNADKYVQNNGEYIYGGIVTNNIPWNIVASAQSNPTLVYDIYATFKAGNAYMFMPCTADISNVTLTVLDKNGEAVDEVQNADLSGGKTVDIKVKGIVHTVSAMQSALPTLSFNINEEWGTIDAMNSDPEHDIKCFGDVRLDILPELENEESGWVSLVSAENDDEKNGTMEIKGRGNSTWSTEPGVKRPYQFKFEKKTDVLGMGKHKTWIILKNDEQIVRNKLGLDLADMIGLEYSGKGEFVDVFMNGQYLGNYLLCEKVEVGDNRVEISNLDDEYEDNGESTEGLDMTGGYLLEIDNWGGDDLQIYHESSNTVMSVKAPEDLAKSVTADNEYGYINNYMLTWLDAVHGDGIMPDGTSYLDYIDVESFVRYFFHQEFLRNGDCGRGSTYMYKDKDSIEPLIYAGPVWDNDRIYEKTNNTQGWLLSTINHAGTDYPTLYNVLNRREDFAQLLVWYYENSDIPEVLESASALIDEYTVQLGNSAEMNRIRWDYEKEFDISWIKETMEQRFEWIDANYKTLTDIAKPQLVNLDRTADRDKLVFDVYNNTGTQLDSVVYVAQYSEGELSSLQICDRISLAEDARSADYECALAADCDAACIFVWNGNTKPVGKRILYTK